MGRWVERQLPTSCKSWGHAIRLRSVGVREASFRPLLSVSVTHRLLRRLSKNNRHAKPNLCGLLLLQRYDRIDLSRTRSRQRASANGDTNEKQHRRGEGEWVVPLDPI